MSRSSDTLVGYLGRYDTLVEVGVGTRPDTAVALAERGCSVTATDLHERTLPAGVTFVRDDVTDPDHAVYAEADVVYALNCPPELQSPLRAVADAVDADCAFTTLGGDPATVPVRRVSLPDDRETLFVVA